MIYFDNAATSWPKPSSVLAAVSDSFGDAGGNPGRSAHRMSVAAARTVEQAREALASFFNVDDPSRFAFTLNATHALNTALYGVLHPGDHVVTTSLEHNSVMRPLRHLERMGVGLSVVSCAGDGTLDLDRVRESIRRDTRLLVATHGSNVVGTLVPVAGLASLAKEAGTLFLLDISQTAGAVPIDLPAMGVDLVAFSGHKGLMGPTGTGGLYVRPGVAITPLMRGGTGSDSAHETQPEFMPDVYESGTLNVAGIAGLGAGVRFLSATGVEAVQMRERSVLTRFLAGASTIPGVTLYGTADPARRCGIASLNVTGVGPSDVSFILDSSFAIMTRAGLHCAPSAHRTLGTFPEGTVRMSFGWHNTVAEVDAALEALREIADWAVRTPNAATAAWTA
jgi:cysteine desulfurase family protein